MLSILALILSLLTADPAAAQGCGPQNPNCIVPTAPLGTSNNQAASTEFVANALAGSLTAGTNITITGTNPTTIATVANPTFATSVTSPIHIGGTAASSSLTLESTVGVGTTDSILFKTGSQVTRWTMDTNGGMSSTSPTGVLNDATAIAGSPATVYFPTFFANAATGRVHRLNRILCGEAALNDGQTPSSVKSWLETLIPNTVQNSQLACNSSIGELAILGGARSSDFRTAFGSATGGAQGLTGVGYNNDTTGSPIAVGLNAVGVHAASVTGITAGNQMDINSAATVVDITPFGGVVGGNTIAGLLTSGAFSVGTTNVSAGAVIGQGRGAGPVFRKGLVVLNNALDTTVGAGTNGVAMEMARNQSIRWLNSTPTTDAEMWGNAAGLNISPALGVASGGQGNATLTSNGILVGNGTGAVVSNRCTMDANQAITCSSASAFQPPLTLANSTADANGVSIVVRKSRSGGAVNSGDQLGGFSAQAFTSANTTVGQVIFTTESAVSGANVATNVKLITSTAGGVLNNAIQFNGAAHLDITAQAVATSLTAGCTGAGSSMKTGSNDMAGGVIGSTAAATTCTVTFGTAYSTGPHCVAVGEQSAILTKTESTTTLVVTFASTANFRWDYVCMGI